MDGSIQRTDTERSFRNKWETNPKLAFAQTLDEGSEVFRWILERNGFAGPGELADYLSGKERILDAGCGNGRVTAMLERYAPASADIVGVDLTSAEVARKNLEPFENATVHEGSVLEDLSALGSFDFIYCQEVLHHTGDPEGGLLNLASLLEPGGEIAIYVYRGKAPIREFTDDFVRERLSPLPYEEAMKVCRQIAELGRALAEVDATVEVPDIEVLGIEGGEYDVQRFVYHFFMKCFWNDEFDPEANAVINYDWYHPELASRHTLDECRHWFEKAGLELVHEHVDPYGITVRGRAA